MTQIIATNNGGGKGGGGEGDMLKSVYDPQNIGKDAFDYDNFTNTPTIPVVPTEVSAFDNDAGYITSAALSGYQTTSNLVTDLTNPDNTHYPSAKAVSDAITSAGGGDMLKATYDPNNIGKDAFDYDNFINTPTIPTVNNSTIEIQENGTKVKDFTLNQSSGETINITVPTKVSDLSNDSGFITGITSGDVTTALGYTPANDTDVVKTSGNQTINGTKTFGTSPVVPSKTTAATNTGTAIATEAQVYTVQGGVDTINGKISSAASSSNKLVDKNYVDDSINSVTAYYITKNAAGDQFATYAELSAATTFYSGGVVRTPTRNDYTIVLADEQHDNATTRYIYNSGWEYQYTVNETALTTAQLNALNSGITSTKVGQYDSAVSTISGYGDIVTHDASEFYSSSNPNGYTSNTGTITSVKMNGSTVASSGEADLGTVVTSVKTINSNSITGTGNLSITEGHDYSWQYLQVQLNNAQISGTKYRCLVLAGANLNITAGSGLTPGMEYILEVNNIAGADINMTFDGVSHNVPNGKSRFFRFICINSTSLSYDGSFDELSEAIAGKQPTLVSGTNIKTVNSQSLLGSGDIAINEFSPSGTATTGYVVTKTADGYEWAAPSGGISVAPNSPITGIKYIWYGTEAQYAALSQYYTEQPGDTEFHCF